MCCLHGFFYCYLKVSAAAHTVHKYLVLLAMSEIYLFVLLVLLDIGQHKDLVFG